MDPLAASVTAYYETGSGEETTLRENELAWRAVRFRPGVLRNGSTADLTVRLLGTTLRTPVLVAPTALHGLANADGERATAAAARDTGSLLVLSTRSSEPIDAVSAVGCPWWFQVYAMRDRDLTLELARRAARHGAGALVLTGDTPVVARKHRPFDGLGLLDRYLDRLQHETGRRLRPEDVEQDPAVGPGMIGELAAATGLPVLVKGVLRGDDAAEIVAAGAAGVVVSNHGGRQLDRAVTTARALPEVVGALDDAVPVLVDGGIRSGLDVLAALAMGADAVLLGRPVLRGLQRAGAAGASEAIATMSDELAEAMRLVGAASIDAIGPDLLDLPAPQVRLER